VYMYYVVKRKKEYILNKAFHQVEQFDGNPFVSMCFDPLAVKLPPLLSLLMCLDYRRDASSGLSACGNYQYFCRHAALLSSPNGNQELRLSVKGLTPPR